MPIVNINGYVSFATNHGVMVNGKALQCSPEKRFEMVQLAFSHINDPPLVEACCGGSGPLAEYVEIDFEDYLVLLREIEIADAVRKAKEKHTAIRRTEFGGSRSQLVLQMMEAGLPYECAVPNCPEVENLTVDHIVPLSRGGSDELENLRFLCRSHNSEKSDKNET